MYLSVPADEFTSRILVCLKFNVIRQAKQDKTRRDDFNFDFLNHMLIWNKFLEQKMMCVKLTIVIPKESLTFSRGQCGVLTAMIVSILFTRIVHICCWSIIIVGLSLLLRLSIPFWHVALSSVAYVSMTMDKFMYVYVVGCVHVKEWDGQRDHVYACMLASQPICDYSVKYSKYRTIM